MLGVQLSVTVSLTLLSVAVILSSCIHVRLKSVSFLVAVAGSSLLALAGGEVLITDSSTEGQDLRILGVVAMTVFIATIIIYLVSIWMIACGSGSHEDPLSVVIGALACGGLFVARKRPTTAKKRNL